MPEKKPRLGMGFENHFIASCLYFLRLPSTAFCNLSLWIPISCLSLIFMSPSKEKVLDFHGLVWDISGLFLRK